MNNKLFIALAAIFLSVSVFGQEGHNIDTSCLSQYSQEKKSNESNFHLNLDFQTKYVWRGMEMMTEESAPVLFPGISYSLEGFYAYFMGGYSINGKYAEVDMGFSYTFKWLTLGINDYYYPTTDVPYDRYFNFKSAQTGHWLEAVVTVDPDKVPVYLTVSNFFYGADKNLEGKQAYSTYAELGGYYDFKDDHRLSLTIGTSLNKSCYNGYVHDFSICNIELKYTYNVGIRDFVLPLSVAYIVNPIYEKSFIDLTASLSF